MPSDGAANLAIYNSPEVAAHYARLAYLTACEQYLFSRYLRPGMAVLDLGVGGGRTTPYLSRDASRYVGVDYADQMVRLCRGRFPQHEFLVADACDLSQFADASFDMVVAAFNGLDYVIPDESRSRCLRECRRVLRKNGLLIFSSHNPRAVLVLPGWDQNRVETFSARIAGDNAALYAMILPLAIALKGGFTVTRAVTQSAKRCLRRIPQKTFWRGRGAMVDPAHGGLLTHYSVPEQVVAELKREEFECLQIVGDDYPRKSSRLTTDWYYYVFAKLPSPGGLQA